MAFIEGKVLIKYVLKLRVHFELQVILNEINSEIYQLNINSTTNDTLGIVNSQHQLLSSSQHTLPKMSFVVTFSSIYAVDSLDKP